MGADERDLSSGDTFGLWRADAGRPRDHAFWTQRIFLGPPVKIGGSRGKRGHLGLVLLCAPENKGCRQLHARR